MNIKRKQTLNLKLKHESMLDTLIQKLKRNHLTQLFTPTVVNFSLYEKYVHEDHLKQIVKLNSPNGEIKALRYDSTISMIVSKLPENKEHFFYIEPQFLYDFDNMRIQESTQLGVELIEYQKNNTNEKTNLTSNFEKCILLVKEISDLICVGEYQIEVSNSNLIDTLISPINLEWKSTCDLKHYISRKNERKVIDVLEKNQVAKETQEELLKLMRIRGLPNKIVSTSNEVELPEEVCKWLDSIGVINKKLDQSVIIDLTSSDRLTYYQGNVFKVYDLTSHKEIISGGEYVFEDFGISGCGFSIKL
ncbi:ATP phosphoribosyltransferase regulatory subunit [Fusibacter bizertensis]